MNMPMGLVIRNQADVLSQRWGIQVEKSDLSRDELIRSNHELEQFALFAAHELQEPLIVASLNAQLFHKKYEGQLDGEAEEIIYSIMASTERMKKLIQSLLIYARAGKTSILRKSVDCNYVLADAIANLRSAIVGNAVEVTCEDCPVVDGDAIQLTQLFQNLINNAIKFSSKERVPHINISAKFKDDCWVFAVQDNGIGVKPEYQQIIFELFKRLNPQNEYAGSGVGLALCQRIVKSHGGHIWLESEVDKGTTFYFTIPKS